MTSCEWGLKSRTSGVTINCATALANNAKENAFPTQIYLQCLDFTHSTFKFTGIV